MKSPATRRGFLSSRYSASAILLTALTGAVRLLLLLLAGLLLPATLLLTALLLTALLPG